MENNKFIKVNIYGIQISLGVRAIGHQYHKSSARILSCSMKAFTV